VSNMYKLNWRSPFLMEMERIRTPHIWPHQFIYIYFFIFK
jgi:hypothetical protein